VKTGLTPIQPRNLRRAPHRVNREAERAEPIQPLESAIAAHQPVARCQCGAPIWGSWVSQTGLDCFACAFGGKEILEADERRVDGPSRKRKQIRSRMSLSD
jgi:hypothetical protein